MNDHSAYGAARAAGDHGHELSIVDGATRDLLKGPPEHWIETLRRFALELGFDTFVFWPEDEPLVQLERFAEEVVPAVRH